MATVKFTYANNPATNDRDAVRWHVGDTDERRPLLDDREVDFALSQEPNTLLAAALCATALAGKFSSKANVAVGSISKALGDIADKFEAHAERLRARACVGAGVSFPATLKSTKDQLEVDDDLINPELAVGLGDNPDAHQINETLNRIDVDGI